MPADRTSFARAIDSARAGAVAECQTGLITGSVQRVLWHFAGGTSAERTGWICASLQVVSEPYFDPGLSVAAVQEELQGLLYTVSHDLRSPLVNVLGFNQELRLIFEEVARLASLTSPSTADRQRLASLFREDIPEALGFIESAAKKMDSMLKGLLALSRMNRSPVTIETVATDRLLAEIATEWSPRLQDVLGSLVIGPSAAGAGMPACQADPAGLRDIFVELIRNGLAFRHADRPPTIAITATRSEGAVTFCVADNGLGIPANMIESIFLPFRRAHPHWIETDGLGLATVRRLAMRMKGKIWAESTPGAGSRFYVQMPAAAE